ncbi:hypothetical protein HQ529_05560 [Candidatus Woesearchaeota archaeon]|nr:hypothetical protein [Candidatus Woesearchaeota archaeon]
MKNKRAMFTLNLLAFLPRLGFLIVVVLSIVVLLGANIKTEIDVFDAQAEVFFQRLVYGNHFSYFDEVTGRLYPGMVDFDKFKSTDLDNLIYYGEENRDVGARISLKDFNGSINEEIMYNRDFFIEKEVLLEAGFTKGLGGVKGKEKELYVVIKDGNRTLEGTLNVMMIIQNR